MKTKIFFDGVMTYIIPSNLNHSIEFDYELGFQFVETKDKRFYFSHQIIL